MAVHRTELRGPEGDLFDDAGVARDLDRVADAERPLDEHPDAGEEVLEDVLEREADDDPHHAERGEDPAERALGVDRKDQKHTDDDDRELRQIAEQHGDVGLRPISGKCAHRHAPHGARDEQGDRGHDKRPKRSCAVIQDVVADGGRIERHPAENTGRLDN